jgi:hypothetical protein
VGCLCPPARHLQAGCPVLSILPGHPRPRQPACEAASQSWQRATAHSFSVHQHKAAIQHSASMQHCCTCKLRLLCSARRSHGLDGSSPLEKLLPDSSTGLAWCTEWVELSRLPGWLCTSALPRCVPWLQLEERDALLSKDSRICLKKYCGHRNHSWCVGGSSIEWVRS